MLRILLALGLSAITGSSGSSAAGLAILAVFDPIASRISSRIYQTLRVAVDAARQSEVKAAVRTCCEGERARITLVDWEWTDSTG